MGAKLILKVLEKEFEEEPFSKGFSSIDTCKNFCTSIRVITGGIILMLKKHTNWSIS